MASNQLIRKKNNGENSERKHENISEMKEEGRQSIGRRK